MQQIFEIASRISTPLALAGLLAACFFLVLRQILARDIFPRLTKALGAEIIRLIINRLFVLSLIATLLGFVAFMIVQIFPSPKIEGKLTLVENQIIIEQIRANLRSADLERLKRELERVADLFREKNYEAAISIQEKIAMETESPAAYTNLGVLYARTGKDELAWQAFDTGASGGFALACLNRGLFAEEKGWYETALFQFQQCSSLEEASQGIERIAAKKHQGAIESEPNELLNPTPINLGQIVKGAIEDSADEYYFSFTSPPVYRDIIEVTVENRSSSLRPAIHVLNHHKEEISRGASGSQGAHLSHSFSANADSIYYLKLTAWGENTGAYRLTVKPLKRYDRYEPNDEIAASIPIDLERPVKGGILDDKDWDYYQFKSPGGGGSIEIFIENKSRSLRPAITLYDELGSELDKSGQETPGGHLKYSMQIQPASTYCLRVSSWVPWLKSYSGPGDYWLVVSAKPESEKE